MSLIPFIDQLESIPEVVAVHRTVRDDGVPEFTVLINSPKKPELVKRVCAVQSPISEVTREADAKDPVEQWVLKTFGGNGYEPPRFGTTTTYLFGETWFLR